MLVGCGIGNVNMLNEALRRHTQHVQLIVFERDDMVSIFPSYEISYSAMHTRI